MNIPELIKKKRDGADLSRYEIYEFVEGYTRGRIPDYQCSALLMAIWFRGLDARETADLTEAMLNSGRTLDFSEFPQRKIGKHSTGGVGDKTSMVVVPVVAAGGLMVPKMSGRGLGHTGGTLDKLESIPGFRTRLNVDDFRRVVASCGMVLAGQTDDLVPADRKLYSLRDVTATVESIPLIAASIMSKKLAEGTSALVLDVKTGSGAMMKTLEGSRALAARMVEIGAAHGKRVCAVISDMDQPLGRHVGNALEVIEVIETLKGRGPSDLVEVCRELAANMFLLGRVETSGERARARFDAILESGKGAEKFAECISLQGGDARVIEDYGLFASARFREPLVAPATGYLAALEAEAFGRAAMALGGGRETLDSVIDPAVGIVLAKKSGERVQAGEAIGFFHYNDPSRLGRALTMIRPAIRVSPEPVTLPPLIHAVL